MKSNVFANLLGLITTEIITVKLWEEIGISFIQIATTVIGFFLIEVLKRRKAKKPKP
jgi:hypothetical protein